MGVTELICAPRAQMIAFDCDAFTSLFCAYKPFSSVRMDQHCSESAHTSRLTHASRRKGAQTGGVYILHGNALIIVSL